MLLFKRVARCGLMRGSLMQTRCLSSQREVFDRRWKQAQRDRAASLPTWEDSEFLRRAMAEQLLDRLDDAREPTPVLVELGSGCGTLLDSWRGQGGVRKWIEVDMSPVALRRSQERREARLAELNVHNPPSNTNEEKEDDGDGLEEEEDDEEMRELLRAGQINSSPTGNNSTWARTQSSELEVVQVCADEGGELPLEPGSADAVVSVLALHWVSDVPALLRRARRLLRPDGLFLAVLLGGDSCYELRTSLVAAELERTGGVSDRVPPAMDLRDAASLIHGSGLALPAVDTSFVQVSVSSAAAAMELLSEAAENACPKRGTDVLSLGGSSADVLLAAACAMQWRHGGFGDEGASGRADEQQQQNNNNNNNNNGGGGGGDGGGGYDDEGELAGLSDPRVMAPELRAAEVADEAAVRRRVGGSVSLTFQTIWMTGFAPSPTQQKPLPRGSVPTGFVSKDPEAQQAPVSSEPVREAVEDDRQEDEAGGPAYPSFGGDVFDADAEPGKSK